jgi:hypothetical protein
MIFFGTVSPGGILELDHPDLYSDLLKGRLANCRVQLDIDRREAKQSLSQKAYYWMYRATGCTGASLGILPAHEFVSPVTGTVLCFSLHHSVMLLERLDGNMTRTDQSRQSVATYQFSAVPWNSYFVLWL